jgi:hypothetical protein
VREPERLVREVLAFVGAQPELLSWRPQEAKMATDYKGRRLHPSVRQRLAARFAAGNRRLCAMLGRGFSWVKDVEEAAGEAARG